MYLISLNLFPSLWLFSEDKTVFIFKEKLHKPTVTMGYRVTNPILTEPHINTLESSKFEFFSSPSLPQCLFLPNMAFFTQLVHVSGLPYCTVRDANLDYISGDRGMSIYHFRSSYVQYFLPLTHLKMNFSPVCWSADGRNLPPGSTTLFWQSQMPARHIFIVNGFLLLSCWMHYALENKAGIIRGIWT